MAAILVLAGLLLNPPTGHAGPSTGKVEASFQPATQRPGAQVALEVRATQQAGGETSSRSQFDVAYDSRVLTFVSHSDGGRCASYPSGSEPPLTIDTIMYCDEQPGQAVKTDLFFFNVKPTAGSGRTGVVAGATYATVSTSAPTTWLTVADGSSPTATPTPRTTNYASLGDSFSSGEGNAPFDGGTDNPGNTCHRSNSAWARIDGLVPEANHFACSGATIANLSQGQQRLGADTTGQLNRLNVLERSLERKGQSLDAVTITIGGNDDEVGFKDKLGQCFVEPDCLAKDMASVDYKLVALQRKLEKALVNVKTAAQPAGTPASKSKVKIILVGYPRLFTLNNSLNTCQPKTYFTFHGIPVRAGWLASAERGRLNVIASKLDNVYRRAAAGSGAIFVSTISSLSNHELCTKDSWVVPIVSVLRGTHLIDQQQAHPRVQWQREVARLVRAALASPVR